MKRSGRDADSLTTKTPLARWLALVASLASFALFLPALDGGFQLDDHFQHFSLRGEPGAALSTFVFYEGDPAANVDRVESGALPWWAAPDFKHASLRYLSTASMMLDHWLWPSSPLLMHLHSLVWMSVLVFATSTLFLRVAGHVGVAVLAALLFAIDDSHALPAAYLANRNATLATLGGVLSIAFFLRWHEGGRGRDLVGHVTFLVLGLAAGELAVAAVGYLVAHAVFLNREPPRKRLRVLAPAAAVSMAWALIYRLGGFGARSSGFYIDPGADPVGFLSAAVDRSLVLLLGQWTLLPADVGSIDLLNPTQLRILSASAVAFVVLVCWRALRERQRARFWCLGMILALAPIAATGPGNRLLLFVGVGGAGLLAEATAQGLADLQKPGSRPLSSAALRLVPALGLALLLVFHLLVAPFDARRSIDQLEGQKRKTPARCEVASARRSPQHPGPRPHQRPRLRVHDAGARSDPPRRRPTSSALDPPTDQRPVGRDMDADRRPNARGGARGLSLSRSLQPLLPQCERALHARPASGRRDLRCGRGGSQRTGRPATDPFPLQELSRKRFPTLLPLDAGSGGGVGPTTRRRVAARERGRGNLLRRLSSHANRLPNAVCSRLLMCGIVGICGPHARPRYAREMADLLAHRGPDDQGVWSSEHVALGHRRLAILDLSPAGHQPMVRGPLTVTYNGEIYNYPALRERYRDELRSECDTEVLLLLYRDHGPACVDFLEGMYAFAIWDTKSRRLFAARDPLGIKPLLYRRLPDGGLAFASELKALAQRQDDTQHPLCAPEVDLEALRDVFTYKYVPTPRTIWRGIEKLPAGSFLTWDAREGTSVQRFWSPPDPRERLLAEDRIDDAFADTFEQVTRAHTLSDVPVGVFLSGGIDSTAVTAALSNGTESKPRTYTLGFDVGSHDESAIAQRVADHLGTTHRMRPAQGVDLVEALESYSRIYDEPFGDHGAWAMHLVARLAREEVKVALTGEGGDELFAGYHWYRKAPHQRPKLHHHIANSLLPPLSAGSRAAQRRLASGLDRYAMFLGPFTPAQRRAILHPDLVAQTGGSDYDELWHFRKYWREDLSPLKRIQWLDLHTYLVDDMLTKVDRATMAVSLEARPPFVDRRIVELALRLPEHHLSDRERGKLVVRRYLESRVPRDSFERPKIGFSMPVKRWAQRSHGLLRDALRRLHERGLLRSPRIRPHNNEQVWTLLVLDRWLTENTA